jgi:hypothetical protein
VRRKRSGVRGRGVRAWGERGAAAQAADAADRRSISNHTWVEPS